MSSEEKEERRISRRKFVKGAAAASVGVGVLASCGPTPAPQIIKETVEVPVEVEKILKETVEVPVEVTKIVEVAAGGAPAEAGPVTLEVLDPSGAVEATALHAPRLDTLEGKTICELSVGRWQDERTFPLIRELLQKQFPGANFIPYTEFPIGQNQIDNNNIAGLVTERGCQAVIVGNAG